jgi:predicted TIM-barrel fold metal-dependent hydrolase
VTDQNGKRTPYRIVSADQHINEPPSLWIDRVSAKFKDRVPRVEHLEQGDAWIIEGVSDPINFGMNSCAGMRPDEVRFWVRYEEINPGGWDPAARLTEMDQDLIDAGINFPTPRISFGVTANKDPELHLAMVQAYNDWLSEYCAHKPDRLFGVALLPNRGVDMAIAEYERVIERPGIAGAMINCWPHGDTTLSNDDDALWSVIQESGKPLTIHVQLQDTPPTAHKPGLVGALRLGDVSDRMLEFLWGGVLDRFPDFRVVFAEVDCGWIPYFKEQLDNRWARMSKATLTKLSKPPSEYFDDSFAYAFITDTYAIDNRHAIGVENMLWSDDFPHVGSDWPFTQRTMSAAFSGVSKEERDLMIAGNATRLYGLPGLS